MVKIKENDWDKFILSLTEYFDDNGTSKVPAKFISSSEFKLGSKVSEVRKMYKLGKLSNERIYQLESFSDWSWSPAEDYWNLMYNDFIKYLSEHSKLPPFTRSSPFVSLRRWYTTQLKHQAKGKLSEHQSEKLDMLTSLLLKYSE